MKRTYSGKSDGVDDRVICALRFIEYDLALLVVETKHGVTHCRIEDFIRECAFVGGSKSSSSNEEVDLRSLLEEALSLQER